VRLNSWNLHAGSGFPWRLGASLTLALAVVAGAAASSLFLQLRDASPDKIPSYVAWTPETIAAASGGDAFRGMLLAKHCDHCHGAEGFSSAATTPNLAGIDRLTIWKQLEDFRTLKRQARPMNAIAESLSSRDVADLVAYYAKLPAFYDPEDKRVFPQFRPDPTHAAMASRLISFGDGERGIPPCQACHGPVAYRPGAPSLAMQNTEYILNQLEAFANHTRTNDINMPMRTIAAQLTEGQRQALAQYYGSGLGLEPASSTVPR
jgi:cytochrome c553